MRFQLLPIFVFLSACGGQNEFAGGARTVASSAGNPAEAAAADASKSEKSSPIVETNAQNDFVPETQQKPLEAKKVLGGDVEVSTLVAEPNGFSGFWVTLSVPENSGTETSFFQSTLSVVESAAVELENIFQQMLSNF